MATWTPTRQYKSCAEALCRGCPPFTQLEGDENGGGGTDADGNSVPLGPTGLKLMHYCFAARTECCSCERGDLGRPQAFGPLGPSDGPDAVNDFDGAPEKSCGPVVTTWWDLSNGCKAAPSYNICCGGGAPDGWPIRPGTPCASAAGKTKTTGTCQGDECCPGVESAHACGGCGGCDSPCPPLNRITGKDARNAICGCCACKSAEWGCYQDEEPCGKQWDAAANGWVTKGNCGGGGGDDDGDDDGGDDDGGDDGGGDDGGGGGCP